MMIRPIRQAQGKLLFGILLLPLFLLAGFALAQEEKTPAATVTSEFEFFKAPQAFNRADGNRNKILDDLEEQITGKPDSDRFDVIVMLNKSLEEASPSALKSKHGDFEEKFTYPSINGFATNLSKGQIIAFSEDLDVKQVEFDAPVFPHLDTSQQWFGTTKARGDFGVDGNADGAASYSAADVVIAILDTGIDPNHVDLGPGKIIAWRDFTPNNQQTPYDEGQQCLGHGTHVASIVAGEGQGNTAFKGVAPGSALIGLKVLRRQFGGCSGDTSWIDAAVQWLIDNRVTYNIKIANMSLGVSGCSNGTDSTSTLVNLAVDAGIVMTVSAGNEGPGKCTIGSPAAAEKAITVGAMADVTPMSSSANFGCGAAPNKGFYLVCFSSRGPTAPDLDGNTRIKPDIASPGVFINAAAAGTTNGYKELSGTSMSSPFTAGVAALMLDAQPSLTPAQIKTKLTITTLDWDGVGADIDYGAGRLDGYEAIKSAGGYSGSNITTPEHKYFTGSLSGTGDTDWYDINITDNSYPLAITFIMPDWQSSTNPDFDIYLYASDGTTELARSIGTNRQETIGYQPTSTGLYKLKVYSYRGSGNYFFDQSAGTGLAVAISITTDGTTPFGILALGAVATSSGDIQTVRVDTGPANLSVKSTNFSDGTNTWALGATNGADQAKWEFSKDGTNWSIFSSANNLFTFDNNVAQGTTRDLYLKITMPTSTSSNNEHSSTVTIVASSP